MRFAKTRGYIVLCVHWGIGGRAQARDQKCSSMISTVLVACCSDRELDGPATVRLLGLSPLPLFFIFGLPLLAAMAAPPNPIIPDGRTRPPDKVSMDNGAP
jgi:hypothetical protein